MMTRYLAVLRTMLLVVLFSNAVCVQAAQSPEVKQLPIESPKRILFVGNSYLYYNDSLHNHVSRIATAADPASGKSLQYMSATINGAQLAHHNIQHLLELGRLVNKQPFDVVILQESGLEALIDSRGARFREKVIEFNAEITKRGAITALYMPHARIKPSKFDSPDMIRKIEDMYVSLGNEVGAIVIPVGLAFEEAYRLRPDLKLLKDHDGMHPEPIGTYLAACVVYASLYGKSPVGNSFDFYGKVDKDTAAFLQKVADQTVQKFFGR